MAKNVIEEIRAKYDLNKEEDVLALYRALQSGEYVLDSPEGKKLDDEVYDLAIAIKKKRLNNAITEKNIELSKEKNKSELKKKKTKKVVVLTRKEYLFRKLISTVLVLIAISSLAYFGFYVYESYQTKMEQARLAHLKDNDSINAMYDQQTFTKKDKTTGEEVNLVVLDEYKSLYSQNKNLIGWLKIADTNIDYPVMQTGDNEYYLNHNINLKEDKNGTLFLDTACDVIKPSTNLIIYGHNMRSGNMFGSLSKYKSESYYQSHPEIEFDSIYEKGIYQVAFAFKSHIYAEDEIAFKYYQFIDAATQKEFDSNIEEMRKLSLYDTGVSLEYGDQLLTLSTCDYDQADGRFVVVGKRIR